MATPYDIDSTGGTLPLPRVHIPTWFNIESTSAYNDALLDLDILKTDENALMSDNFIVSDSNTYTNTKLLDLGGNNNISNATDEIYKNIVTIGTIPPRQGNIVAYSDNTGSKLSGTNSAHVLYFEHAELKSFNFIIPNENHVINRIQKLYRPITTLDGTNTFTEITNLDTTYDVPDPLSYRMVVIESDATVPSGTMILKLVEGGH